MLLDIREKFNFNVICIDCDFIMDVDGFGNVVGVECIDYCGFLNEVNFEKIKIEFEGKAFMSLSFDSDSGCFYIKINDERPVDQKVIRGTLCKNTSQEIVAILVADHHKNGLE